MDIPTELLQALETVIDAAWCYSTLDLDPEQHAQLLEALATVDDWGFEGSDV